jgi:hypothetical protein
MPATTAKTIYTANAHLTRQAIEVYDQATDTFVPMTGGTFTVSFATSANGSGPISGLQALPLAAVAGAPGSYFAVIQAATLAPLVALVGTIVYQIVQGGPFNALRDITPMMVSVDRYAQ